MTIVDKILKFDIVDIFTSFLKVYGLFKAI